MNVLLSVEGLEKSFKDKKVLHGISFEVHSGEIMAILGPNGAGKSTTIRSIMGIFMADEGSVIFHNHKGKGIPRNKIGYLPEERGLCILSTFALMFLREFLNSWCSYQ